LGVSAARLHPVYLSAGRAKASISSSVGKRPSCFFENRNCPSTVTSNTPPREGT
jgi:hypothetical protein